MEANDRGERRHHRGIAGWEEHPRWSHEQPSPRRHTLYPLHDATEIVPRPRDVGGLINCHGNRSMGVHQIPLCGIVWEDLPRRRIMCALDRGGWVKIKLLQDRLYNDPSILRGVFHHEIDRVKRIHGERRTDGNGEMWRVPRLLLNPPPRGPPEAHRSSHTDDPEGIPWEIDKEAHMPEGVQPSQLPPRLIHQPSLKGNRLDRNHLEDGMGGRLNRANASESWDGIGHAISNGGNCGLHLDRTHACPNIEANRRGEEGPLRGNHRSPGGTSMRMGVGGEQAD